MPFFVCSAVLPSHLHMTVSAAHLRLFSHVLGGFDLFNTDVRNWKRKYCNRLDIEELVFDVSYRITCREGIPNRLPQITGAQERIMSNRQNTTSPESPA